MLSLYIYIYGNIYHQYIPNVSIYTSTMDPMGYKYTYIYGGFPEWGYSQNPPSHETILVLKPVATWPQFCKTPIANREHIPQTIMFQTSGTLRASIFWRQTHVMSGTVASNPRVPTRRLAVKASRTDLTWPGEQRHDPCVLNGHVRCIHIYI